MGGVSWPANKPAYPYVTEDHDVERGSRLAEVDAPPRFDLWCKSGRVPAATMHDAVRHAHDQGVTLESSTEPRHYRGTIAPSPKYWHPCYAAWMQAIDASPWRIDRDAWMLAIDNAYERVHALSPASRLAMGRASLAAGGRRALLELPDDVKALVRLERPADVAGWLAMGFGPCVIGGPWRLNMEGVNRQTGFIGNDGARVGGHAVALMGVDFERQAVRLTNNRGQGWGQGGRAWMHYDQLRGLLRGGEAYGLLPMKLEARRGDRRGD